MIRKACFLYIMVWAAKNGVMTGSQGFDNLAQMRVAGSRRLVTVYITAEGFGRMQINHDTTEESFRGNFSKLIPIVGETGMPGVLSVVFK